MSLRPSGARWLFLWLSLLAGGLWTVGGMWLHAASAAPYPPGVDSHVALVDVNGNPISVGGGTQYADGTVQAGASGNAILWNDTGNTLRIPSAAKPLPVTVFGGGSATSATDAATWTAGSSLFNPIGGVFNDSATALTSGQQGTARLTPNRAAHVNLRSQNGTELFPVPGALADATTNPTLTQLSTFPFIYNGTSWDRWKDMAAAQAQTSFTGVPAMAPFYLDTTGTPSVRRAVTAASTTGGVSGTQVPSSSMTVYDGTNFQTWKQVTAATGTTGAGIAAHGPLLWDSVGGVNYVKQAGDGSGRAMAVGAAASGATASGNPVLVGGSDGTNARSLSTDTSGHPVVNINKSAGFVSTLNSSTTTLAGNAVFTGTGEDVSGYSTIVENVFTDQAGTLSDQFSSDGTHWDAQGSHPITASTFAQFVFRPGTQFFRVVYTNGASAQGAFRLQTIYKPTETTPATAVSLGAALPNPTTFQMGANLLVQSAGGTTWSPANADSSNNIGVVEGPLAGKTVLWAAINITSGSGSGDHAIVSGTGGKKIRVLSIFFTNDTAGAIQFKSSGGTVVIPTVFDANVGLSIPLNPDGWFMDTLTGEGFTINDSVAANIGGRILYLLM